MSKLLFLATAISTVAMLGGCSTRVTYHNANPLKVLGGRYNKNVLVEEDANLWVGFVESPRYGTQMIEDRCPSKKGYIKKHKGFAASLVQLFTIGIYSWIDVELGCLGDKTATMKVRLTTADAAAIIGQKAFLDFVKKHEPEVLSAAVAARSQL